MCEAQSSGLQRRFDSAATLSADETTKLLADLHSAREFAAFAYLWDTVKAQGGAEMDPELYQQLYKAHGKNARDTLTVPSPGSVVITLVYAKDPGCSLTGFHSVSTCITA